MHAEEIRANWPRALESCADVREISCALKWGFTDGDLATFRRLYRAGQYREKILALLEDCNFHTFAKTLEAENGQV